MTDLELATELISRLNTLLENPRTRKDITWLLETRVGVSSETVNHPTIQVVDAKLGFIGLLNGIVGVIPEGRRAGWGYITAVYGDDGIITHFCLTTT